MRTRPAAKTRHSAPVPFNKEISRFKLALNSGCPLRCEYCFLDKDSGEVLTTAQVRSAVELALGSPGTVKKLLIYGGEPFLHPALLRETILHARRRAAELGKDLAISVATSGALLATSSLEFLRGQSVQLAISIDGDAARHDRHRPMKGGSGSHARILRGLPAAFASLPKSALIALLGAHPRHAGALDAGFRELIDYGFENVNIEVIHGFPWSARALREFDASLERLRAFIVAQALARRFLFLESSYRELLPRGPSTASSVLCPFDRHLEVFPNGDYSFYPFPFISGARERRAARVGSVDDGFLPRYRDCSFDAAQALCRDCRPEYYRLKRLEQGNEAYALRAKHSRLLAAELRERLGAAGLLAEYLREASERDHLGFSE